MSSTSSGKIAFGLMRPLPRRKLFLKVEKLECRSLDEALTEELQKIKKVMNISEKISLGT